jgi:hypothetical protein
MAWRRPASSRRRCALLAYLALEADRPHARDALAGLLWPNQPDHDARNNLRQALADQRATPPFLLIAGATIQFNQASDHHSLRVSLFFLRACAGVWELIWMFIAFPPREQPCVDQVF